MSITGATSSTLSTEKEDVVAVQDNQQAEDVTSDGLVMYKTDFRIKKSSGSDERCNKNENDKQDTANDLSGKFNGLNVQESDLKNGYESKSAQCSGNVSKVKSDINNQLAKYRAKRNEEFEDYKKDNEIDGKPFDGKPYDGKPSDGKNLDASDTRERKNDEEQKKINVILKLPLNAYRKQVLDLHQHLDIDDRALKICDEFDFSDRRRPEIELSRYGGGNPAKIFLVNLKISHGEESLEFFNRVLEENKVNWPKMKETKNKDATFLKISQLDHNDINYLSCYSNLQNNWKSVAGEFGYSHEQIENIARHQQRPNNFSCSESVFRIISQEKPEYSIGEFMFLLHLLKFNDAFNYMKTGVTAWAREIKDINSLYQLLPRIFSDE